MSEYQYYEFVAVDRPLTREQMAELRAISSRAEITPTRFTNVYTFGSFRGDETDLVERYFDAHVYVANWGTHILMFGMPARAVDLKALLAYQAEYGLAVLERRGRIIVTFESQNEDGGGWVDDDEGSAWMSALIGLRADLMNGDLRAAYLGWLRGVQSEGLDWSEDAVDDEVDARFEIDDVRAKDDEGAYADQLEPPVPPGLGSLTAPLASLVEFLQLDEDLIAVAAVASVPLAASGVPAAALRRWVEALPVADKDSLLVRLMQGETQLQPELVRRFHKATQPQAAASSQTRRTIGQLLQARDAHAAERKRREAEATAQEHARRAEEAARAREAHLRSLIGQERELWQQVEWLVSRKLQKEYDRAVQVLVDLRDLATREGKSNAFSSRFAELRARHANKPSFMRRLDEARLV